MGCCFAIHGRVAAVNFGIGGLNRRSQCAGFFGIRGNGCLDYYILNVGDGGES